MRFTSLSLGRNPYCIDKNYGKLPLRNYREILSFIIFLLPCLSELQLMTEIEIAIKVYFDMFVVHVNTKNKSLTIYECL